MYIDNLSNATLATHRAEMKSYKHYIRLRALVVAAFPKQTQGSLSRGIGHLGTSIPPGRADPGGGCGCPWR